MADRKMIYLDDAIDALAYFTEKSPTGRTAQEVVKDLPSAQPDRSCKTCRYVNEFLGGVFLCRRLKESKRVQPDFCCKKWRGKQDE